MQRNGDRIFTVQVVFIDENKIKKHRNWGYFFSFEDAEKVILNNITDIFEMNYYNYAFINEVLPGVPSIPVNFKEQNWYKAQYPQNFTQSDQPEVVECQRPLDNITYVEVDW